MVAGRCKEHLRLVLQTAESLAVNDAVAVALKCGTDIVFALGPEPAARLDALRRLGRQNLLFARLELLSDRDHKNERKGRKGRQKAVAVGVLHSDLVEKA